MIPLTISQFPFSIVILPMNIPVPPIPPSPITPSRHRQILHNSIITHHPPVPLSSHGADADILFSALDFGQGKVIIHVLSQEAASLPDLPILMPSQCLPIFPIGVIRACQGPGSIGPASITVGADSTFMHTYSVGSQHKRLSLLFAQYRGAHEVMLFHGPEIGAFDSLLLSRVIGFLS